MQSTTQPGASEIVREALDRHSKQKGCRQGDVMGESRIVNVEPPRTFSAFTAFAFRADAASCVKAARRTDEGVDPSGRLRLFLVSRAIELALKAFLRLKHVDVRELKRRYGHDLEILLQEARALGLDGLVNLSEGARAEIAKANAYYTEKVLEHAASAARDGYPGKPDYGVLEDAATALANGLEAATYDA